MLIAIVGNNLMVLPVEQQNRKEYQLLIQLPGHPILRAHHFQLYPLFC